MNTWLKKFIAEAQERLDVTIYKGTPCDDEIDADPGHSIILGFGGDDYLRAGQAADAIFGGRGADFLIGGGGHDLIRGGGGADRMLGGDGHDLMTAMFGNDEVFTGAGKDRVVVKHFEDGPQTNRAPTIWDLSERDTIIIKGADQPVEFELVDFFGDGGDDSVMARVSDDKLFVVVGETDIDFVEAQLEYGGNIREMMNDFLIS